MWFPVEIVFLVIFTEKDVNFLFVYLNAMGILGVLVFYNVHRFRSTNFSALNCKYFLTHLF